MRARRRPLAAVAAALAAAGALSGCGNKIASLHGGETEGIYVTVGKMLYQVQISRQLNPQAIPEDRTFVGDIAPADQGLRPGQLWFAVFVRIENGAATPQRPATEYTITDTQGNVYRPVEIGAGNPMAYRTDPIGPHQVAPDPDSVAGQLGSIDGMELLFKLTRDTLVNRPLTLHIKSFVPSDESEITLDV